jgi:putative membrane protein insertion efficiency factor
MLNVPKFLLIALIRVYQLTLSPLQAYFIGGNGGCRFTPSCSAYAADALREHGAVAGTVLAAKRICRCHPWGGCGHDPVPPKSKKGASQLFATPSRSEEVMVAAGFIPQMTANVAFRRGATVEHSTSRACQSPDGSLQPIGIHPSNVEI